MAMNFVCDRMYFYKDSLEIAYEADETFNVEKAKRICRMFENSEIAVSRITAECYTDLSDTCSFFDSSSSFCKLNSMDELKDDDWSDTLSVEYNYRNGPKNKKPLLTVIIRRYGTRIKIFLDFSQNKLYYIPAPVEDKALLMDEMVAMIKGDPDREDNKLLEMAIAMVKNEWYDEAYRILHEIGRDREIALLLPERYKQRLALEKELELWEKNKK